jgi:hypothetical protein
LGEQGKQRRESLAKKLGIPEYRHIAGISILKTFNFSYTTSPLTARLSRWTSMDEIIIKTLNPKCCLYPSV